MGATLDISENNLGAGGLGIVVIAKKLAINTNVQQINTLEWENGCRASNTVPLSIFALSDILLVEPLGVTFVKDSLNLIAVGNGGAMDIATILNRLSIGINTVGGPLVDIGSGFNSITRTGDYEIEITNVSGVDSYFDFYVLGVVI